VPPTGFPTASPTHTERHPVRLTTKIVGSLTLPAGKTDVIVFDNEVRGFGYRLRQGAGGTVLRSWVVQYKRAGTSRRMLLGSAAVLGAEAARLQARKVLGAVALGQDPAGDRRDRRDKDRNTMRALVGDYLAAKRKEVRPKTFAGVERYLTGGYFKPLHNMAIDTITRHDVARRVVSIARESGDATAREARGALSTFFVWCLRMGLCEQNPVNDAVRPAELKPRERVLSNDELTAVWRACGEDEYGKVIRLLILTGCRRSEVGDMRWSELDLDGGIWSIPAARSKNGWPHTLPLMPTMLDIIRSVPRMVSRDALFGQRAAGFTKWALDKPGLDQRSGVSDWTTHDLRRSVATGMADIGIAPHVIEAVLNHRSGSKRGVAGVYNRSSYANEVRAALALWADHLRTIIAGGERKVLNFEVAQTAL
jgi:integrase